MKKQHPTPISPPDPYPENRDPAPRPVTGRPTRGPRALAPPAVLAATLVASALAVHAGAAAFAPPPPLPGRLVYSRAKTFQWNLFLSDPDGANEAQLTRVQSANSKGDDQPRWSPDGREIAFSTFSKDGDKAFIWRVPYTGGTPTPVAEAAAEDAGYPAWSPDGRSISFAGLRRGGGPSTLDLMVRDDEGTRALIDTGEWDERASDWAPDGERIVYEARHLLGGPDMWWTLRVVGADGGGDQAIYAEPRVTARHPRWSPDGTRIAFVTHDNEDGYGKGTLWVYEVESGALSEITSGVANPATWSPDGEWLLVYNTLQTGLEFPAAPTPTRSPPSEQLFGLYLIRLADRALFRPGDAAGGASARANTYEWGQVADWTAGTYTPTPDVTVTPTRPTPTDTAIPPSPTASRTPSPTRSVTPTVASPTPPEVTPTPPAGSLTPTATTSTTQPPIIYLPIVDREAPPARR